MPKRYFVDYIKSESSPQWSDLPLTHIAKAIDARDIISDGKIVPVECPVQGQKLVYTFYGRASYRVTGDGAIKSAALCPVCFVLNPDLMDRSKQVYPFDTGAYDARLFKHHVGNELHYEDFDISGERDNALKLIGVFYNSLQEYMDVEVSQVKVAGLQTAGEFELEVYSELIISKGRNEPDDRVSTIEVSFGDPLILKECLLAVIIPDVLLRSSAEWITKLKSFAKILPYKYRAGKGPEYHNAQIDFALGDFYKELGNI